MLGSLAVLEHLIVVASVVERWLLGRTGLGLAVGGLSYPTYGIFLTRDQTVSPALAGGLSTTGPPGKLW